MSDSGQPLAPPPDWAFLPAGDAGITRRIKAKGPTWVVQVKKGRRLIAKGIWANKADILASQKEVAAQRETADDARKRGSELARREANEQTDERGVFE